MKKNNVFSSRAFRKGTASLVIIAVVVVAVILVNVLTTALSKQYPFSLDLTAEKDYTLTLGEEYETFVKSIDQEINVVVCASEEDFENNTYASNMAGMLALTDYAEGEFAESTTKYGRQVAAFVKTFPNLNRNIQVEFVNPSSVTDFAKVKNQFSDLELTYGDIVISCEHVNENGGTFTRKTMLTMNDIFTLESDQQAYYSGYGEYCNYITGSSLAGQMVSSLYIVLNEESVEVAVLGGHGVDTDASDSLKSFLTKNNYTFTEVDNILTAEIGENTTFLILATPQTDYSAAEINKLQNLLENDGKYGRTLVYLPSSSQPELPKLEEFLVEWGIEVLPAVGYDESMVNYFGSPYYLLANVEDTDYTADYDESVQYVYPLCYRLLNTVFESKDGYVTTPILTTGDTAVGEPLDDSAGDDWTPETSSYKGPFDLAVLSTLQKADSSASVIGESHVLVLSGDGFVTSELLSVTSVYNSSLLLNVFNSLAGVDETNGVNIEDKVISTTSFYDQILNTNAGTVVMVIFVGVIPLGLIIAGVWVWKARKKK